jgi:hypothetical protein
MKLAIIVDLNGDDVGVVEVDDTVTGVFPIYETPESEEDTEHPEPIIVGYRIAIKPPEGLYKFKFDFDTDTWVEGLTAPPVSEEERLAKLRVDKIVELNTACDIDIAKGFISSINGHKYGLMLTDQLNFLGMESELNRNPSIETVRFKVEDLGYQIDHTREEFFQVMDEGLAKVKGLIMRCNDLKEIVIKALSDDDIMNVNW